MIHFFLLWIIVPKFATEKIIYSFLKWSYNSKIKNYKSKTENLEEK